MKDGLKVQGRAEVDVGLTAECWVPAQPRENSAISKMAREFSPAAQDLRHRARASGRDGVRTKGLSSRLGRYSRGDGCYSSVEDDGRGTVGDENKPVRSRSSACDEAVISSSSIAANEATRHTTVPDASIPSH